jgi:riboflavin kinase/FMN adenylyltransferase
MQVFFSLDALPQYFKGAVVTLGVFDGLHLAHMEIIQRVINSAVQEQTGSMAVTFDQHPRKILNHSGNSIPLLTTLQEKLKLLEDTDLDATLFLKVDETLLNTSSEAFVEKVLVDLMDVKRVIVGYDYHFGKGRGGRAGQLIQLGQKYGFSVETVSPILLDNKPVRSSLIRLLLEEGQVGKAAKLLGRYYGISGYVVHGTGRGNSLGFPTANIEINDPEKMIPSEGVYLSKVQVNEQHFFGICEHDRVIEVYLMNAAQTDLYGAEIEVDFLERLRGEIKFDTIKELKNQMILDEKECLKKIKNKTNEKED